MMISENVMRGLSKSVELMAKEVIETLASKYGFSSEEAIRDLGVMSASLEKKSVKKSVKNSEKKEKSKYTLPFNGCIKAECCKGVKFNNGLFTQCESEGEEYCGNCAKQAEKNSSGEPDCGRIEARVATGLYDYKDPKGRSPLSFAKYMQQKGWSQEEIVTEASRQNTEINAEHFVIQEEKKGGRPKKAAIEKPEKVVKAKKNSRVVESEPELADLFATLVAEAAALSVDDEDVSEGSTDSKKAAKAAKAQALAEEKAAKALQLQAEKDAKALALAEEKAVKAAKLAEEKSAKEAKQAEEKEAKAAKVLQLQAEKDAKTLALAEEKAAKALQLQAEKAAKAQALADEKSAKAAKQAEEKEAKAAAKLAEKKPAAKLAEKKPATSVSEPVVEEPVKISAKKFEHNGKKYARDQNGIVYDRATCEAIGKWDEEKQDIILDPVDDDVVETEDELEEEAESDEE